MTQRDREKYTISSQSVSRWALAATSLNSVRSVCTLTCYPALVSGYSLHTSTMDVSSQISPCGHFPSQYTLCLKKCGVEFLQSLCQMLTMQQGF